MPPKRNKGNKSNKNTQKEETPKDKTNEEKNVQDEDQTFTSAQEEVKQPEDQQVNDQSTQPETTENTESTSQKADTTVTQDDAQSTQEKGSVFSALNQDPEANENEEPNPFEEKDQAHTEAPHQNTQAPVEANHHKEETQQQDVNVQKSDEAEHTKVEDTKVHEEPVHQETQPSEPAVTQHQEAPHQVDTHTQQEQKVEKEEAPQHHATEASAPAVQEEQKKPEEHTTQELGTVEPSNHKESPQTTVVVNEPGLTIIQPANLEESIKGTVVVNDQGPTILETTVPANNLEDSRNEQGSGFLTSSIKTNWENIEDRDKLESSQRLVENRSQVEEKNHTTDLTSSHVVVDDHARNESIDHGTQSVNLQGSMHKNWEVVHNRRSEDLSAKERIYEQEEDMRSDKASDNAASTRLMDDQELHAQSTKEIRSVNTLPTVVEQMAELSHEQRLAKVGDDIQSAKALKTQTRYDEAINVFHSARNELNPERFAGASQSVLEEINQKILECAIESADCYNQLNEFSQSINYARIVLKANPKNLKALYLLGIGLVRIGDLEEAHVVLREVKTLKSSPEDAEYLSVVDKELEKLDQIAESKALMRRTSSAPEEAQPLISHEPGSIDSIPEEKREHRKKHDHQKKSEDKHSGTEYFLGSLVSSGALSFVVAKYVLKLPTRQGVLASLIVGTIVGGVSLITHNAFKKDKKGK